MSIQVRSNEPVAQSQPKAGEGEGAKATSKSAPVEKVATEHNPDASESDTEVKESESTEDHEDKEEGTETDLEAEGSEESEEAKEGSNDKPKKKGGFQRRIDKLNARFADKEREAEYWRQLALKSAGDSKAKPEATKPAVAANEAGKPSPDDFENHVDYVEAIADWKAEQKLAERDRNQEQSRLKSEQEKAVKAHMDRVQSFAEKKADWDDVISDVDDIPVSPTVRELIVSSDNGPALMYELAKNREEFERINRLTPLSAAREMGKIEMRLSRASEGSSTTETKKITKAPKPISAVNAGGKGTVAKSIHDPNLSQAEYERLRREQIKRRQT